MLWGPNVVRGGGANVVCGQPNGVFRKMKTTRTATPQCIVSTLNCVLRT